MFPCRRYSSTSPARRFLSFSLTPDELPQLEEWGDCPRLFEDLRDLRRPLRVGDSSSYVRSLRLSAPVLQCKNPARYADTSPGVRAVGLFASEKKDGREFTIENEEVSRVPERFVTPPGALKGNRRFGRRSHHADRRARPRPRPAPPNTAEQRNGPRLGSFSRATCAAIPSAEFEVPDRRQAGLYSVRFVEVAGADHRLLEPGGYRAAVPR